jgi:hypothetical protein
MSGAVGVPAVVDALGHPVGDPQVTQVTQEAVRVV